MKIDAFRTFVVLAFAAMLFGCGTMNTDMAMPAGVTVDGSAGSGLKSYKRAYIESLQEDEFQIYPALFKELNDMGIEVVGIPIKEPTETDLVVKYSYDAGWDFTRYLQSFQFQFLNAKTGKVVAMSSFKSRGIWQGVRDGRLEAAFNDLRAKNGYPPTRQFQR
ncbi:hypothetical protein [Noviherbaspirillum aridicola]|nr:hypothetical protein [Noviherbaspirillum aridicola]